MILYTGDGGPVNTGLSASMTNAAIGAYNGVVDGAISAYDATIDGIGAAYDSTMGVVKEGAGNALVTAGPVIAGISDHFVGPGWERIMADGKPESLKSSVNNLLDNTDWRAISPGSVVPLNPAAHSQFVGNVADVALTALDVPYRWAAGARSNQPYTFRDFINAEMPQDIYESDGVLENIAYDPLSYVGVGIVRGGIKKLMKKFTPDLLKRLSLTKFGKAVSKPLVSNRAAMLTATAGGVGAGAATELGIRGESLEYNRNPGMKRYIIKEDGNFHKIIAGAGASW